MKSPALNFFICFFSFFFLPESVPAEGKTDDFHICYFSLNNEKEFTEMQKFTKKLNEYSSQPISINEYMTEGGDPEESFKKMVESGEPCDGLVISGHHTGSFGGKRAPGSLGIDFLEKLSCDEKYSDWFDNINAVWLQGCRTLGTGEIVSEEESSADYHTGRVGAVLEADHLEQSFADLNMEFSATLDQDNPLSSRYLRVFPGANVFGWTKTAPGERAGSQYSIPFHIAHTARRIDKEDRFPSEGPLEKTWTKESAMKYMESIMGILSGEDRCNEDVIEAWKNHGRVRDQSRDYGFDNPDLNAYPALLNTEDEILKQARYYDCLLKQAKGESLLEVLDRILEEPVFIRYTYNSLLERLKSLKEEDRGLRFAMIQRLKNSEEMNGFLSRKLKSRDLGILRKIDYYAFYEEIYGRSERIREVILDKVETIFKKLPSRTYDEVDYKRTLLESLSKHGYLKSEKGIKLLQQAIKDKSGAVRRYVVVAAGKIGEKGIPILKQAIKDKSSKVRRSAVEAAGQIGDKGLPILKQAIKDESSDVRFSAVFAVGKIGEKALPIVQQAIKR